MSRLRYNNVGGTLGAPGLSSGATAITFTTAPPFATLVAGDYIPLVIEPPQGSTPSANFEIAYLTAYTAGQTTGTVTRAQEGTSAVAHASGAGWTHGPTALDLAPAASYLLGIGAPSSALGALGDEYEDLSNGDLYQKQNVGVTPTWVVQDKRLLRSLVDAKGDILVATADDTMAKLSVGPDTQVLTADSAQGSGMKWAAAASGALVLLNTVTLGANGIFDVTGISQAYSDLILVLVARDTAASNIISPVVLVNNDTGANYYNTRLSVVSGSATPGETLAGSAFGDSRLPGSTAPANSFGFNAFVFPGYASTVWLKTVSWESFTFGGTITGNQHMQRGGGTWNSTAAINRVTVKGNGNGNLLAGSQLRIYGRS